MTWLAYFILFFLAVRLAVSLTNLFTRQWLRSVEAIYQPARLQAHNSMPLISVLIPARNEADNICSLLSDISYQNYPNIEILVYDDLSEDNTGELVESCKERDSRIRLIGGRPLPDGWLGKNHACHQLALEANGEYLLFLDADVRLRPSLLYNSFAHMKHHRLDLLSIFPAQEMRSFGEKITVPVMNWVLTGLLPLILTRTSSRPSLSAANGQFMMFRTEPYKKHMFHLSLKNSPVEDIGIFRLMKRLGYRTHTLLSNGDIGCRMYRTWKEAVSGFSRNVAEYFGGSIPAGLFFALLTTFGIIPVALYLSPILSALFIVLTVIHRLVISYISRQPLLQNLLLAPFQQLSLFVMVIAAIRHRLNRVLIWKGRNVYQQSFRSLKA
ncbi:MAG: glycosyltransferase [Marinilabiliales bacterium]|nr:MAG: glycosyltransferase [Marinilabiliales bacterium]